MLRKIEQRDLVDIFPNLPAVRNGVILPAVRSGMRIGTCGSHFIGPHLRGALVISVLKTILHPLLMWGAGRALGLTGLPLAVMVVAAALPVGANVFLFSQRYKEAEDLVTASVAVSTLMAVGTVSVVMGLLR